MEIYSPNINSNISVRCFAWYVYKGDFLVKVDQQLNEIKEMKIAYTLLMDVFIRDMKSVSLSHIKYRLNVLESLIPKDQK